MLMRGDDGWSPPEKVGGRNRRRHWDEGLVFVKRRASGKLGVGGVRQEVGVGGGSRVIASAFSVKELVAEGVGGDGLEQRGQGLAQPAEAGDGEGREPCLAIGCASLNLSWQLAQL